MEGSMNRRESDNSYWLELPCMSWTVWTYLLVFGPGPTENPIRVPNPAILDLACGLGGPGQRNKHTGIVLFEELSFWGDFGDALLLNF